jgi:hypothetical protein
MQFLGTHIDVIRVPLRLAAALPDTDSIALSSLVMRLFAMLRSSKPAVFLRFVSQIGEHPGHERTVLA